MADRPVINRARSRDISSRYVRRIYRRATADLSAGIRFISATQRSSRSRRGLVNLLDAPRRQPNFSLSLFFSLSLLFVIFLFFRFHPSLVFVFKRIRDWPRDVSSQIENSRFWILHIFYVIFFIWIWNYRSFSRIRIVMSVERIFFFRLKL